MTSGTRPPPIAFAILTLVLALGGCSVGPDYVRPEAASPGAWSTALEGGLLAAQPEPEALARWWTALEDPMLTELMQRAAERNLAVDEAEARVREARARRSVARAGLFPSVEASAAYTHSRAGNAGFGSFSGSDGDSSRDLYQASFDSSWELDLFGGTRRGVEAATADLEASDEDLRDVLTSLFAELALAYVDLRLAQAQLVIAQANLESQSETFDIARWRAEAGLTTALDVEQARTSLEETRSLIPAFHTAVAQAKNRIAVLTGAPPGALEELDARKPIPTAPLAIAVSVPADTLLRRPDVRRAERELAAETARVGVATAAAYPRISLIGSIGLEALTPENLVSSGAGTASLAASAAQTIFDFGRIRGNIEAQDAVREQALARFQGAVLAALEEVENALVAFSQEQARRQALHEAAAAAERAATLSRNQYASGLVDFETVLIAQRSLFSLQDQLAQSESEVTANVVRLYKALGGGWAPADA